MAYPIAPISLTIALGSKRNYSTNLLTQRFNGGVDERSTGFSLNPTEDSWSLDLPVRFLQNYNAIEAFLQAQDGKPFRFDWDGDGLVGSEVYWVESHRWTWEAYQFWKLSVELKRVFRP